MDSADLGRRFWRQVVGAGSPADPGAWSVGEKIGPLKGREGKPESEQEGDRDLPGRGEDGGGSVHC